MGTARSWIDKTVKGPQRAAAEPRRSKLEVYRSQIEHAKLLESMHATYDAINKEAGQMILAEQLYLQPQHLMCAYTVVRPGMNYQMALVVDERGPRLVFSLNKAAHANRHYGLKDVYQLFARPSHYFLQPGCWLIEHQLRILPAIIDNIDLQQWFSYLLSGFRNRGKPLERRFPDPKFGSVNLRFCVPSGGVLSQGVTDSSIESGVFLTAANLSSERTTPAGTLLKIQPAQSPAPGHMAAQQTERTTSRRHFRGIWALRVACVLTLLFSLAVWTITGIGRWLVVSDPLQPATAIVVVGGDAPFRAIEAAAIFRQGWAPEVWVPQYVDIDVEAALTRLGLHSVGGEEIDNFAVLNKLGVPRQSIRYLNPARNSQEEILGIARELARQGGKRVILVTSPAHTRRLKEIWRSQVGDAAQEIVRYASTSPFDADHWWRNTEDANAVQHEVFGILNVWAGFPLRAARTGGVPATASPHKETVINHENRQSSILELTKHCPGNASSCK